MEESFFKDISEKTLCSLADYIESADEKGFLDVEYQAGILTITLKDKRQYVINQHVPMRQIWLSSPISGAFHFNYLEGKWVSTRGDKELISLVKGEIESAL